MQRISIIIPVKPGGAVRAIGALWQLDWPEADLEVLVAEGCLPSRQRNLAARQAGGELLYFLDDDALLPTDALQRLVGHFADQRVAVVGGPSLTPVTDRLHQQAFAAALSSRLGGGAVRNRYRRVGPVRWTTDKELILCNLAIRRQVFLEQGGLDERLYPNEENELLDRLQQAGLGLVHDPELAVQRSQRPTWRAYLRQLLTYGRGRGEQSRVAGRIAPVTLLPTLLLFYLLGLTLVPLVPASFACVYTLPLLCYATGIVATALAAAWRQRSPALLPLVVVAIPLLHAAYGVGLPLGLASPRFLRSTPAGEDIRIRRVKEFDAPWSGEASSVESRTCP